ncbi:MAG TPA: hypothetical protein VK819_01405 [Acidobacteriaceae bacterium]|jgi:hypothetical protein|nr:hypothetical protein [Acidobacteriaceae bacterium]
MNYLATTDYQTYGLDPATDPSWVTAASAMIDAHCRRQTIGIMQYEERLKMPPELNTVRLSFLPLVTVAPNSTPIVSLQGRYGIPRRGEWPFPELSLEFALVFALPGMWTTIDPTTIDIWNDAGELTFPINALGLFFNEVDVVYNAGYSTIPTPVQVACAQIVKNAQITPGLNVQSSQVDQLRLQYFGPSLIDDMVKSLLKPYVSLKGA